MCPANVYLVNIHAHTSTLPKGDAEKVSIDAFNKLQYGNGVVVGITFVKVCFFLYRGIQLVRDAGGVHCRYKLCTHTNVDRWKRSNASWCCLSVFPL